jgi:hypothetical protein
MMMTFDQLSERVIDLHFKITALSILNAPVEMIWYWMARMKGYEELFNTLIAFETTDELNPQ